MSNKRTAPLSVRLSPELNERLETCADKLRMKKHSLAQEAIEAAVDAIEANGFKLVVPVKFEVTHIATQNPTATSPSNSNLIGEPPGKKIRVQAEKFSGKTETPPRK